MSDRLAWFRDARFGMFLHFGLYSVLGRNEWAFYLDRYTVREYAALADRFKPAPDCPKGWAEVAAQAGMKYMVLTTRHHDGFCLFDSRTTNFTSVKRAARRDIVAEYVEACRGAGLKVGLYYSLGDWRFKGAWQSERYPDSARAMVQQAHDQVRELMTGYGRIDLLWYDGAFTGGNVPAAEFYRSAELNAMVRQLQPDIIINDRSGLAEDYGTPECVIKPSEEEARPWESCLQMDSISWGNVPYSPNLRTGPQIVVDLIEVAAGGGNLLLNTGPQADGPLRPEEARRILEAGAWLGRNAEAIYGSRRSVLNGGPMGSPNRHARWIGSKDPCVHYLAALCWMGTEFMTVLVDGEVRRATCLTTGRDVAVRRGPHGRLILADLPPAPPDPLATVFRIEFAAPPRHLPGLSDGSWLESDM